MERTYLSERRRNVRMPSDGDLYILEQFKQKRSAILDSQGKVALFEIGG